MTYDNIIMELSERLADESDYDDNLQPKLQKLQALTLDKAMILARDVWTVDQCESLVSWINEIRTDKEREDLMNPKDIYENKTIDELENLYHELKVRKNKGIGGEGIKDIQFRRYIETLIERKRREEVNG